MRPKKVQYLHLEEAEGSIEAKKDQTERLEEFTQRVGSGEFHVHIKGVIICGCIDGRKGCTLKPNAAGGTESVMVSDDLTYKSFADVDGTTASAYKKTVEYMQMLGLPVGGHDGPHANADKSDCGANDRLDEIYAMIARKADVIRALTESLGSTVNDKLHELIIKNATARQTFSSGAELRKTLEDATDGEYDHLEGSHKEVLAVINRRAHTTLDRDAVAAEFGDDYQAFNMDVWAFEETAKAIKQATAEEVNTRVVAMLYYNFATALVLCGPKMRVVVLD